MAKINIYIPEPKENYEPSNLRQIIEALTTLKTQLNFSFQFDLKEEQDSFNWFIS
jgi:hypothetical protein|tara:strand:+ start:503 stop:667 length:165 start_codon:yes stop_codon:yes gene_type:complete